MSYLIKLILYQKCRSEKDESNGGGRNKVGATLVERETRGKFGRNFVWHVAVRGWSDEDFSDSIV